MNVVLSTQYWTSEAGRHAIRKCLSGVNGDESIASCLGVGFELRYLNETASKMLLELDERAGLERLQFLVICSANLETFLQESIGLYVASLGHRTADYHLDAVGKAIAKPVVGSSSVPEMLKYTQVLLKIDFGSHLAKWIGGYKLRCAAAHEGGLMSSQTAKQLGGTHHRVGEWIRITWDELKDFMSSAHVIADLVDKRISTPELRRFEPEWIFAQLKNEGRLPQWRNAWKVAHEWGFKVSRPDQRAIERRLSY